jgi:hypothetical protein
MRRVAPVAHKLSHRGVAFSLTKAQYGYSWEITSAADIEGAEALGLAGARDSFSHAYREAAAAIDVWLLTNSPIERP